MFLQPTIHGAAGQSQSLGSLADVSFVASESALNQIALHFVETHLFQFGYAASGLRAQAEVRSADRRARGEEHAAFHGMIQFADVARPGMLMQSFDSGGVEPGNILAIALRVAVEEMVREEIDVLAAVSQRAGVGSDCV